MNLQQDVLHQFLLHSLVRDQSEEFLAVDALDESHAAYNLAGLVGLEMADKVPADVGREFRNLCQELLNAAFAEEALSGIVGLADGLHGVELADGHQGDAGGELGEDSLQVLADHLTQCATLKRTPISE